MADLGTNRTCEDSGGSSWAARLLSLLIVLAVCAGIRLWLIELTDVIAPDGTVYVAMARQWTSDPAGVIEDNDYHVGYTVTMVGAYRVIEALDGPTGLVGWEWAGQAVSFVASLLAITAVWCFTGLTFNWRAAWAGALLFGIGHKWAALGADVLSDALAVCLGAWALVLTVLVASLLRRRSWWSVAAAAGTGVLVGGGYLVRPEVLAVVAVGCLLWLVLAIGRRAPWGPAAVSLGVALGTTIVCSLPYMLAIGGLSKKKSLGDLLRSLFADAGPMRLLAFSAMGTWTAVGNLIAQIFEAMHPVAATAACVWMGLWVFHHVLRRPVEPGSLLKARRDSAFVIWAIQIVFVVLLTGLYQRCDYLSHRHLMLCAVALSPLVGAGVVASAYIARFVTGRIGTAVSIRQWVVGIAVVTATCVTCLHTLKPIHEGKEHYRQAAQRVADLVEADAVVLADSNYIAHYGGVTGEPVPMTTDDRVDGRALDKAIRNGRAGYLVLSDYAVHGGKHGTADQATLELCDSSWLIELAAVSPHPDKPGGNIIHIYRIDRQAMP
ncbi:MAG: ArnT family glycosyltransferase [Planctomycetota bacterium]|jgi:hypothetical protein